MDRKEAMLWIVQFQMAKEGNEDAKEVIAAENELRAEEGRPSLEEELMAMVASNDNAN